MLTDFRNQRREREMALSARGAENPTTWCESESATIRHLQIPGHCKIAVYLQKNGRMRVDRHTLQSEICTGSPSPPPDSLHSHLTASEVCMLVHACALDSSLALKSYICANIYASPRACYQRESLLSPANRTSHVHVLQDCHSRSLTELKLICTQSGGQR